MNGLQLMLTWLLRFNLAYLAHEVVFCASHPSSCRRGTGEKNQTWLARCRLQKLNSISWPGGPGGQGFWACLYIAYMQHKVNQTNCIQLMVQGVLASLFQSLAVFQFWLQFKRGRVWPSTLAAVLCRQCGHRNTYAGLWHLLLAGYAIKCQDQKIKKRIWSKKIWSYVILLATFFQLTESRNSLSFMAQGHLRREVNRVLDTYWRGREGYAISATWKNLCKSWWF